MVMETDEDQIRRHKVALAVGIGVRIVAMVVVKRQVIVAIKAIVVNSLKRHLPVADHRWTEGRPLGDAPLRIKKRMLLTGRKALAVNSCLDANGSYWLTS